MFDTRKFILHVKRFPCLWKTDDDIYRNKRLRTQAWQLIGKDIYPDWPAIDIEKRMQRGNEMQKKWKNIRDRYIKDTRMITSGLGNARRRKKRYPFFELLDFLGSSTVVRRRNFKKRADTGREETNDEETATLVHDTAKDEAAGITALEIKQEEIEVDGEVLLNAQLRPTFVEQPRQMQATFDEQLDADKAFFHSLLPIVRKFDDTQKMDMRIEILNVIKEIQRR